MQLAFDHLVHFVNRPEQAIVELRKVGLIASPGGQHEKWGSYNALCYFDLSYVEFLGLNSYEIASQVTDNDLIRQAVNALPSREGFARLALRTDCIDDAAERMRKLGLEVTGPFPGSRKRQDGTTVSWSMFFMKDKEPGLPLPFVIQWEQSDEERRRDLKERQVIQPHPIGAVTVRELAIAVRELEPAVDKWSRITDLHPGDVYEDEVLQAKCRKLSLPGGELVFCAPVGTGTVSERLNAAGEGPFLLRLSAPTAGKTLSLAGGLYQLIKVD
ncbi:glyoxalase-like domain-containing protein [Paenibacillus sp. 32O-W]|uniref:VOC family protein n=1 Tax=Paenibacillus sp. 32O-W TaxID=1695218 RepID=UPI000721F633|nr:VOC family protein [Paenibacillus sp. 32O-W]ALS29938.1 glyoxalase-like domain-containing protein [Paenibacillus sp. 32O-W]